MIVFLNEHSLEDFSNWGEALAFFWKSASLLTGKAQLYKDSHFFFSQRFRQRFDRSLAGIAPDIRANLRRIAFEENYWQCWRPTALVNPDESFRCETLNGNFQDDSLSEASERLLTGSKLSVRVVSAPDSGFAPHSTLLMIKVSNDRRVELRNAAESAAVDKWIVDDTGAYHVSSTSPPHDFQTILVKAPDRFRKTKRVWHVAGKDRIIYEEIATGHRYYVDHGHWGHAAHLEVFDENGRHLGEADITNGRLDPQKCDASKRIHL